MKTKTLPLLIAAVLALLLLVTGCVVTSVYPYYTDKDVVFETKLLGDWTDAKDSGNTNEFCRIEKFGDSGYLATNMGDGETNSTECHLFRLKNQLFLDTCATNRTVEQIPVHQLQKVQRTASTFETTSLNYDWLAKLLEKNPKAIRHIVVTDKNDNRDDKRIVLTADTTELQKFVLKHLNDTNAWSEPSAMKIRPATK
jgi:hypothetical protein